jgi:hypothetical protein
MQADAIGNRLKEVQEQSQKLEAFGATFALNFLLPASNTLPQAK